MTAQVQASSPIEQTVQEEVAHPRNYYIFWALSLIIAAACAGISHLLGLSVDGCAFFGITVLAICLWGFNLLHEGLVAVMLPIGYLLTGVGTPKEVLAPWTQPMGWLILGGLMTGLVLMHTGLARRIALWSLHITGGSFVRLLWGLLLAGFIIAPLMPTALGKGILISIICMGVCDALGFAPRTREASTMLMAGVMNSSSGSMAIVCPILGERFLAMGVNAEALHRVIVEASSTLDSTPQSGFMCNILNHSHTTHRQGYWHVCVVSVIAPIVETLLLIPLCALFGLA